MTGRYIITMEELNRLRKREKIMLVDVREKERYEKGHLQGAVCIPYNAREEFFQRFVKGKIIVFYCERGNRSMKAATEMRKAGYTAYSLAGGYESFLRFKK